MPVLSLPPLKALESIWYKLMNKSRMLSSFPNLQFQLCLKTYLRNGSSGLFWARSKSSNVKHEMMGVIWYSFIERNSPSRENLWWQSYPGRTHKNGATETVGRAIWERARRRWERTPPDRQRSGRGSQLWGRLIGLEYGVKVSRASVRLSVTRVLNRGNCWGSCNLKQWWEDVWGASANERRKPNTTVHTARSPSLC